MFEATYKQKTRNSVERSDDYLFFGLMEDNGIFTNAGVLFSDQCPVSQSKIFCTRWNGLDKGSIFDDTIDDKEYEGNLIKLLEQGTESAVFEAMVNALIHKLYDFGFEVHIDMYMIGSK